MADQDHDQPGEPPTIRDEAADSPMWLPALGLSLLLLGAVFIVWRSSNADEVAAGEAAETAQADEADSEAANSEAAEDDDPNAAPE